MSKYAELKYHALDTNNKNNINNNSIYPLVILLIHLFFKPSILPFIAGSLPAFISSANGLGCQGMQQRCKAHGRDGEIDKDQQPVEL